MTLSRLLAYPFVAWMALGVIALSVAVVWSVAFNGKAGDWKGIVASLGFITWWSWAGISVYLRYIRKPREEKKRQRADALAYVEKTITLGSSLSSTVEALRKNLPLVGEPRHRPSADPSFDALIEIEAHGFIISLFSKDGVVRSWNVQ